MVASYSRIAIDGSDLCDWLEARRCAGSTEPLVGMLMAALRVRIKGRAPVTPPCLLERVAVAPREQLIPSRSIGMAQFQRDPTAGLARSGNDARAGCRRRLSRQRHIAELLVLPGNLRPFGLPMQTRACDTFGEMAPVGRLQGAFMRMRTGRDHMGAALDQLAARGENALPSSRRARLDNDQRVGGQVPQPV